MQRKEAIERVKELILAIDLPHHVRVGIDGVDATGKTRLADELVAPLESSGREVVRVSVDGFHNPQSVRHRQGRTSALGYYEDSFNYPEIITNVLKPLGPGGDRRYKSVAFDFLTDSEVDEGVKVASPNAILVFEGIFMHRPELRPYWDFSIFVHADFNVTLQRAQERDLYLFKTPEKVREIYEQRYIPGEKIYLDAEYPMHKASLVWNNNIIEEPQLTVN